ncbi:MAG: hypothetical protein LAT52_12205 [Balneolales bacterium]|nr:hypothetical protein [Balneolales bacterium]
MADNEKIHQILEYICTNYDHGIVDTDEISHELNMPLSEVNMLAQKIIQNGDAKLGGRDKDSTKKGIVSILQTVGTNNAYLTRKYLKNSKFKNNISLLSILKWTFAILGAFAAAATIYQVLIL